jgi:hypothetical protein
MAPAQTAVEWLVLAKASSADRVAAPENEQLSASTSGA